jgi:hypothetical protein
MARRCLSGEAVTTRGRAFLLGLVLVGCGSSLRTPNLVPHPEKAGALAIIVDYPPPAAQVEMVPKDPGEPCVWVDGHWDWTARRWQWFPGAWVTPPEGCNYAPPDMIWVASEEQGELYYRRPRWYPENVKELQLQQALAACRSVPPCGRSDPQRGTSSP